MWLRAVHMLLRFRRLRLICLQRGPVSLASAYTLCACDGDLPSRAITIALHDEVGPKQDLLSKFQVSSWTDTEGA